MRCCEGEGWGGGMQKRIDDESSCEERERGRGGVSGENRPSGVAGERERVAYVKKNNTLLVRYSAQLHYARY